MAAGTTVRRRAGRRVVAALTAALLSPAVLPAVAPAEAAGTGATGTRTSGTDGAGASSSSASLAQARRQAREAAARVDALAAEYRARSRAADRALATYASSFSADVRAGVQRDLTVAELDAALAARARTVRAVYASGGVLTLGGSVLGARSVDEAIWRLDTSHRLLAELLDRRGSDLLEARRRVALADQRQHRLEAGSRRTGLDLAAVQDEQDAADLALLQARRTLDGLDARVAGLQEARAAAARLAAAEAAAAAERRTVPAVGATDIPSSYATAYRAAAGTCPGMDWTLLAGVGQVESGHGRNNGPSSAGAIGPMQFMPATFRSYAVDGDHDGRTDAWDPEDAIFTAARYLCASGAGRGPQGVHDAVFAYNHAEWYVDLVLGAQHAIRARFGS